MEKQGNNQEVLRFAKELAPDLMGRELAAEEVWAVLEEAEKVYELTVMQANQEGALASISEEDVAAIYLHFSESGPPDTTLETFLSYWAEQNPLLEITLASYSRLIQQSSCNYVAALTESVCMNSLAQNKSKANAQPSTNSLKKQPKNKDGLASSQQSTGSSGQCTEDSTCSRLKDLFQFYTRQVYKGTSATFDQIPNDLAKMDLTGWMVFNKNSNTTSILGKDRIHAAFKKHSTNHYLDFSNFHDAIKDVLCQIHPDNMMDGWRMLGVHSSHAVSKRMSKLGVASYLYQSHSKTTDTGTNSSEMFRATPVVNLTEFLVTSPLKPVNTPKLPMTLSKLAKMKSKPTFELPAPEPDDDIYLKSYILPKTENREKGSALAHNPRSNIKKSQPKKPLDGSTFGQSSGIISRIDERINIMARKL